MYDTADRFDLLLSKSFFFLIQSVVFVQRRPAPCAFRFFFFLFFNQVEKGGVIVDFGCGVGTSTRLLAGSIPDARRVIGIDLSPYMVAVGKHHNQEKGIGRRVSLLYGDVANTRIPDGSASLVSCTFLLHEMPEEATRCVRCPMLFLQSESV